MKGIKLITRFEYDEIMNDNVNHFDTYTINDYAVDDIVALRCYFAVRNASLAIEIDVQVTGYSIISYNSVSAITLYRVDFKLI